MKSRWAYGGERGGRGHGEHSQNEMEGGESGELKEKACRSLKRKGVYDQRRLSHSGDRGRETGPPGID